MTKKKISKARDYLTKRIRTNQTILNLHEGIPSLFINEHKKEIEECTNLMEIVTELERINQTV